MDFGSDEATECLSQWPALMRIHLSRHLWTPQPLPRETVSDGRKDCTLPSKEEVWQEYSQLPVYVLRFSPGTIAGPLCVSFLAETECSMEYSIHKYV